MRADVQPDAAVSSGPGDLISDELTLARGQIEDGLEGLAERTLRRLLSEADAAGSDPGAVDAMRGTLAEALWRQGRPRAAADVLAEVRGDEVRRVPLMRAIEADAVAAAGDLERATAMMDALVGDVGVEVIWEIRAGVPSRLAWPQPVELSASDAAPDSAPQRTERHARARARLHAAREALAAGDGDAADDELALALRLDPASAGDGLALIEPHVHPSSSPRRHVVYGDLLAAMGRQAEADAAYERATGAPRDPEPREE